MNLIKKIDSFFKNAALALGGTSFFKKRFKSLDRKKSFRDAQGIQRFNTSIVGALTAAFVIFVTIWFLSSRIVHYFEWPMGEYKSDKISNLYNLTKADLKWDVFYGRSEKCGEIDCHLTEEYPKEKFLKSVVLPSREFPLHGYKKGQFVYSRAKIKIPESLIEQKDTIVFHSIYIHAERYTFYINENLVFEGSSDSMYIPIPREYINDQHEVFVSVKINPGNLPYQGIAHRLDLYLGPAKEFKKMRLNAEELKTTYYLWFLLPKISFCVIFAFLFLAVSRKTKTLLFIIYAFLSSGEVFFRSEYPNIMLGWQANWELIHHILDVFSMAFLLLFLHDFFERKDVYFSKIMALVFLGLTVFSAASFSVIDTSVSFGIFDGISLVLREASILMGVYYSLVSWVYLATKTRRTTKGAISGFMCFFFSFSAALITVCVFLLGIGQPQISVELVVLAKNTLGLYDLAFFAILAAVYSVEIGITFARHDYIEKELEEAANMASAFQPDDKPDWDFVDIDVYHRPFMKASGDWFAFSQSKSGKYSHYIMCDITGHGIQAAIVVSTAKTVMSHLVNEDPDSLESVDFVKRYAKALNSTLYVQGKGQHVVTLLGITFVPDEERFHYVAAGHPLPIHVSATEEGKKAKINPLISRNTLLGLAPEYSCSMRIHPFREGDELVTYTDGVILKVSRAALSKVFAAAREDDLISSKKLFQITSYDERKQEGKITDDDVSIVRFYRKPMSMKKAS